MGLSQEVKQAIIQQKIEMYEQQYYGLTIDMELAENIEGISVTDKLKEAAEELRNVIKYLEGKLED